MEKLRLNERLKIGALDLCKQIAASREIVAACFYGPWVWGYANEQSDISILLVLSKCRPRLRGYFRSLNGVKVSILSVDQGAFIKDVEQGWLGEFIAEKISTPYEAFLNKEYLWNQEVKLKKRIIWELLETIVSDFPELSHELLIQPEYFLYEEMARRARLFTPITYSYLNMLMESVKEKNVEFMMRSYSKALNELSEEDRVILTEGLVRLKGRFDKEVKKRRVQVPNLLKSIQKAVSRYVLSVFPQMTRPYIQDQEIFLRSYPTIKTEEITSVLEDPNIHLLIPTPLGLVNMSENTTIEDFVKKAFPDGNVLDMKIEGLGGALNSVYLLTLKRKDVDQKVVMKKYRDWSWFKWFPLAFWTLGTQDFAVLGRSRLEREYAINQFLRNQGFSVPQILFVSLKEPTIFEEFVEGEKMTETIKRALLGNMTPTEGAVIKEVGRKIAEVHKLGVSLGDCKPENIIITKERKPTFIDLEQATRNGNREWDIAEFLYYSGHYVSPTSSLKAVTTIASEFIEEYLEAGGEKETVRKAGSIKYTKIFSIFTFPHVILAISDVCKKKSVK